MKPKYRVLAYYYNFFGRTGYKLQKRSKFLFREYWETIEDDKLGMVYQADEPEVIDEPVVYETPDQIEKRKADFKKLVAHLSVPIRD